MLQENFKNTENKKFPDFKSANKQLFATEIVDLN
jgi:hypothetical protein